MKSLFMLALVSCGSLFAGTLSSEVKADLMRNALEAQKRAYAPYSRYFVGAALLTKSGKTYLGCNVENASYGFALCAERTAVFKAVSEGDKDLEAIAVVTRNGGMPCGGCRQVLNEFNPNIQIICMDEQGKIYQENTLKEILPHAFGPSSLD